ncbi:hypothetical protein I4F81_009853 [Pyropia yezoensis]|uniref:Uncharacterized protein n=1 Tax=Pyropia yezoensis TaxID=2788 RepID=A0ACC3CAQ1_PYRYE|nr:hypothetical protein I4F81_009853 [Neopyropia yezoensis]
MRVVELIPGLTTSPATVAAGRGIAAAMGMAVAAVRDEPGFAANRLLMPYINEAAAALGAAVASRDAIDAVMVGGTGVPMGPLALADFIGLDTCVAILRVLEGGLGGAYKPALLLVCHVAAGWLGVKSGRGFYDHQPAAAPQALPPTCAAQSTRPHPRNAPSAFSSAPPIATSPSVDGITPRTATRVSGAAAATAYTSASTAPDAPNDAGGSASRPPPPRGDAAAAAAAAAAAVAARRAAAPATPPPK